MTKGDVVDLPPDVLKVWVERGYVAKSVKKPPKDKSIRKPEHDKGVVIMKSPWAKDANGY